MFMDPGDTNTENFEEAIRSYITTFQFDNTVQDDLYRKLDEVCDLRYKIIYKSKVCWPLGHLFYSFIRL